ncbi:MAG TPA: cobalt ECF transporter T component CbiQ, partial [Nitrospirota bacterium]|nr:cobalt ECF transporter T component CbiQ [Nitrospirota bacterium]
LLQKLDIRFQIAGFAAILVLISLLHTPQALWLVYGAGLAIAALSRVPLWFFVKRVWLFVPLFSAAVVIPAVLNVVTPGDPLWVLVKLPRSYSCGPYSLPAEIAVTRQGLWGGIVFLSRVAASVSLAVLFTLTHRWADIFTGLRALHVPRVFVMTLSMTERYLFVFLRLIQDMYRARKSRTIRTFSAAAERSWTASRIGVTFRKSVEMSNDVYKAMLSRGFHGEFRSVDRLKSGPLDLLWLLAVIAGGGALLLFERGIIG